MSFDLYLQRFEDGEPAGIPRDSIRAVFGQALAEEEAGRWSVAFGRGDSCELFLSALDSDPRSIYNITVNRPCRDRRLWDGLACLLATGHCVIHFPDSPGLLMLDTAAAAHLPSDMLDALGPPVLVRDGQDILRCVEAA